ncbi:uncharacterized protein LAJ45_04350 [Morchella importuna]|uniref:rRNA adenine N(6)-methyltransferase n=1 Tax=Morchella conica CCBAS932 TaxID=1392247 RepID=A0A3N4KGZ5_9PEZI|nr:uncharacterized protein LAJ45_04350 [Morchella importuna]KAH8151728.1 hypothetical protein LAJ45_04350 [Morchella importuna]RPB08609.1 hypothetical protein P167DRAFT_512015 [Morchella conica CCBAS932]
MRKITEAASRTLTKQLTGLFKSPQKHAVNIVSPTLCEQAISRLDLSAYKNPILIDMSPGICTWSAALHDALQPRAHILLEPEKEYKPWIDDFQSTRPNIYWLPEQGDRWSLYMSMFGLSTPPAKWPADYPNLTPRTVPPEDGVNPDIIFTGNLSESEKLNSRLLAQLIATIPRERWLMTFGRVRFLTWILDETKVRYLPRTIASRIRATVMAEAVCDVTEVASSNTITTGRGHPKASVFKTDADGNLVVEPLEEAPPVDADAPPPPRKCGRPKGSGKKPPKLTANGEPEQEIEKPPAPPRKRKKPPKEGQEEQEKEAEEKKKKEKEEDMDFSVPQPLKKLIARVERGADPNSTLKLPFPLITATLNALQAHYTPTAPRISSDAELPSLRALARDLHAQKLTKQHTHALSILTARLKDCDKNYKESLRKLTQRLTEYLTDPATRDTWLEGMEHPAWYYHGGEDDVRGLAEALIRKRRGSQADPHSRMGRHAVRAAQFDDSLFAALERSEETAPPAKAQGGEVVKMIADYNRNWDAQGKDPACDIRDDEIFSYENKLLEFHRREYEPITVQPSDFYPEAPLALLDFTPKLLHPHLRNPDHNLRDKTWETFNWLLRTLFLLRAHTISSALATLAPGGEHILDNLAPGVHIDPEQRTRTLTADELVEITRAWETWPFRNELLHLEEYTGGGKEAEVMSNASHAFRVKTLNFGR